MIAGMLQMGLLAGGVPVLLKDVVIFEAGFGLRGRRLGAGFFSNLAKAMLSKKSWEKFCSPSRRPPLWSAGGMSFSALHTPLVFDQFRKVRCSNTAVQMTEPTPTRSFSKRAQQVGSERGMTSGTC
jgi:hypothetical protein